MAIIKGLSRYLLPLFIVGVYTFLYMPLLVVVLFSFNSVAFPYRWVSFSTKWYVELFQSSEILEVTKNSLIVASASSLLSLTLALFFVFYGAQSKIRSYECL